MAPPEEELSPKVTEVVAFTTPTSRHVTSQSVMLSRIPFTQSRKQVREGILLRLGLFYRAST